MNPPSTETSTMDHGSANKHENLLLFLIGCKAQRSDYKYTEQLERIAVSMNEDLKTLDPEVAQDIIKTQSQIVKLPKPPSYSCLFKSNSYIDNMCKYSNMETIQRLMNSTYSCLEELFPALSNHEFVIKHSFNMDPNTIALKVTAKFLWSAVIQKRASIDDIAFILNANFSRSHVTRIVSVMLLYTISTDKNGNEFIEDAELIGMQVGNVIHNQRLVLVLKDVFIGNIHPFLAKKLTELYKINL